MLKEVTWADNGGRSWQNFKTGRLSIGQPPGGTEMVTHKLPQKPLKAGAHDSGPVLSLPCQSPSFSLCPQRTFCQNVGDLAILKKAILTSLPNQSSPDPTSPSDSQAQGSSASCCSPDTPHATCPPSAPGEQRKRSSSFLGSPIPGLAPNVSNQETSNQAQRL